ncbi:MAG: cupin domain-containing protein [Candidatus Melainabacteria bacterium]|nr:cupin domain-containing protein [Candidatus Melainabacteria bacterium]MBI3308741.1 cupin domain-containing protein [Candidatus Melainabacteria bacterium]
MLIKDLNDCSEFIAGDGSILKELLHAGKQDVEFRYSLAHATVFKGKKTSPHILKTSEVYYIISGKGLMHIDNESDQVSAKQAIYIPPGSMQFIENIGDNDLEFLCIVDPAWDKKDEIIVDDVGSTRAEV